METCVPFAPLPVELVRFDADWNGANAELLWSTATEINNSHFEIYRSFDGKSFEYIGQVNSLASGGTSNELLEYSYEDLDVQSKTKDNVYYQLRQVDFNGTTENHGTVALKVNRVGSTATVQLYPNPTRDIVTINATGFNKGEVKVLITDITGNIIFEEKVEANGYLSKQFSFTGLRDGIYFVNLSDSRNSVMKRVAYVH